MTPGLPVNAFIQSNLHSNLSYSLLQYFAMPTLLIYGAAGYTGRLASEHANSLGLDFVVAGRAESSKTTNLAAELGVPSRLFCLDEPKLIDLALQDISVLLNCAGPFLRTAEPLMEACIRNKVHYLDVAAELDSYKLAEKHDQAAKEANVMLLPGCGGSVTMLGCLAGHAVERVKNPLSIDISLYVSGSVSRGSAISAAENMSADCFQRLNGELVKREPGNTIQLDFDNGEGDVTNYQVTLPDVITIGKSTSVPNVRTFMHAAGDGFPTGDLNGLPDGPTAEQREASPYHATVAVTSADGTVSRSVLHTVNGYTFTGKASVEGSARVLAGIAQGGFQTPALIFGNAFIGVVADSTIRDL